MHWYNLQEFAYTRIVAIKTQRVNENNALSNCEDYNAITISRRRLLQKKDCRKHVQLDRKRKGNNEPTEGHCCQEDFGGNINCSPHTIQPFRGPFLRLEL